MDHRRNTTPIAVPSLHQLEPLNELTAVRARLDVCLQERHELEIELLNLKRSYIKAKNELKRAREDPQSSLLPEEVKSRFERMENMQSEVV